MPKCKSFEPSSEDLERAGEAFQLEFVCFGRQLERLEPNDFLPRYNRLRFKLSCRSQYNARPLFVTVRRNGSKIGADNYWIFREFSGWLG